jgi:lysozyme
MKQIYYYIIDYKEIHPIRFWIILIMVFVFLAVIWFVINRLLKSNKKIKTSNLEKEIQTEVKSDIAEVIEPSKEEVNGSNTNKSRLLLITILFSIIISLSGIIFFYEKSVNNINENPSISSSEYVFGIDISQYQGKIDWSEVRTSHHPIEFVFIRATMGEDGIDRYFKRNWENAKKHNYVRGAYHYYRPNENSTKQFENFKSVVKLKQGDFIPVLDIEKESRYGRKNLREGVLNWLKLAEKEYGAKPIIYTGLKFYQHVLKGHVDEYPLWIAAYSGKHRLNNVDWTFHQFTEKVRIKGIRSTVDGNDFKRELIEMDKLRITNANTQ